MAAPKTTTWNLDPHTRAKHEILRRYLEAWTPILSLGGFPTIAYVEASTFGRSASTCVTSTTAASCPRRQLSGKSGWFEPREIAKFRARSATTTSTRSSRSGFAGQGVYSGGKPLGARCWPDR